MHPEHVQNIVPSQIPCSRSAERIFDATADEGYKNSVGKQSSKMALFKISLHCFQGALDKHQPFFFLK